MQETSMTDLEKLLAEVTPGEWRVEDRTTLIWGDCNQNDTSNYGMGYPIAEARRMPSASWTKGPKDYEEAEANAHLIAMAPALARKVIAAEKLAEAVREIASVKERKKNFYPEDWKEQIAACQECQRYKNHPIQRGICDEHRRPIYAQEDHDRHETKILGYRAMVIAREALSAWDRSAEEMQ